jgi:hypothetical protein
LSDNSETGPRLPGARRLHRGIQGQEIGLEGNFIDGFEDF